MGTKTWKNSDSSVAKSRFFQDFPAYFLDKRACCPLGNGRTARLVEQKASCLPRHKNDSKLLGGVKAN